MAEVRLSFPEGPWQSLLVKAYGLLDKLKAQGIEPPPWSLGGGTVLMFYYNHRISKDIDIFVPDPQFLGYVNPRLGGPAEELTADYADGTEYIKLTLPEGEIDFVASATLTKHPYRQHRVLGREILLESPIEIVAKKIWHRGTRATARDLLDLSLVIEKDFHGLLDHKEVFAKNINVFVEQCVERREILEKVFGDIDTLDFSLPYDECLKRVQMLQVAITSSP